MSLFGIMQKTTLERIIMDWDTPDVTFDVHDYWGELKRASRNYGRNHIFEDAIIYDFKLHYKRSYLCIILYTFKRNINLTRLHVL